MTTENITADCMREDREKYRQEARRLANWGRTHIAISPAEQAAILRDVANQIDDRGDSVVTLELPSQWVEKLGLLRVHPDDEDTLEQRLYDLILERVDGINEALREQSKGQPVN